MNRVVVVGAGIGGLVSAVELAAQGLAVTVVEKESSPGGKMRQIPAAGRGVDAGPTVFTMRWVFDELLAGMGSSLEQIVTLKPLQILARHAWDTGGQLDLFADRSRTAEAIAQFAGAHDARRYLDFCERAAQTYRKLETPYLRSRQASVTGLIRSSGWRGLSDLVRISPFATLWDTLTKQFHDPRLQQLFGRYATYCGSSPFLAPATLMLIAHVEQEGVWLIEGGMYALVRALAALAERHGATFRFDTAVSEITVENGRATGVRLQGGDWIAADAVVVNGDANAVAGGLFGAPAGQAVDGWPTADRSLSAITWTMAARCSGFPLIRHNVFFGADYRSEFDQIFRHAQVPLKPTMYICAQDRDDAGVAPSMQSERLLCLVNAPADGDRHDYGPTEISAIEERSFALLRRCGLDVEPIETPVVTTPTRFHRLFPATGGALYGQASHGWKSCFTRPTASTRVGGLFLAGGSTHPGAGVPMAALSGRFASAAVIESLTRRRHSLRN